MDRLPTIEMVAGSTRKLDINIFSDIQLNVNLQVKLIISYHGSNIGILEKTISLNSSNTTLDLLPADTENLDGIYDYQITFTTNTNEVLNPSKSGLLIIEGRKKMG